MQQGLKLPQVPPELLTRRKNSQRKKQCGRNNKTAFEPSLGYIFFIHWKACFAAAFPTHAAEGDVSKSQIPSLLISAFGDGQKRQRTARLVQDFYSKTTVRHLLYSCINFASYPFKLNVVPYRMPSSPSLPPCWINLERDCRCPVKRSWCLENVEIAYA